MTPRYLEQLSDILSSVTRNEQQLHCVLVLLNLSMQSLDCVTAELVDSITILREQVRTRAHFTRAQFTRAQFTRAYYIVPRV